MPKFYVTYGWPLRDGVEYSVVEAHSYIAAKSLVQSEVGNNFGMLMDACEFSRLASKHLLEEVPLDA